MATFLTADWHLGETRMDLMMRPFSGPEEHDRVIIEKHNSIVKPDDKVIVIGDACASSDKEVLAKIATMNGHKVLIRGNHDRKFTDEDFAPYFEKIVEDGGGMNMEIEGVPVPCYLTHYPSRGVVEKFNIVGHIHSAWKFQMNMVNIGVDCHHFYPVPIEKISFFFNAISKFYDDDVFAAYWYSNMYYQQHGERGQRGSYFKEE